MTQELNALSQGLETEKVKVMNCIGVGVDDRLNKRSMIFPYVK